MSDKIKLGMLCGVLQSNFSRLSQSESRTQPCHVRITIYVQSTGDFDVIITGCVRKWLLLNFKLNCFFFRII